MCAILTYKFELSIELQVLDEHKNSLLSRREINIVMKGIAGNIKRIDAAQAIAHRYNVDKKTVIPISMLCQTGKKDLYGKFYIYDTEEQAKRHLPRYRFLRNMNKEDRKRLIDSEKAANLKSKQASSTKAQSKGKSRRG